MCLEGQHPVSLGQYSNLRLKGRHPRKKSVCGEEKGVMFQRLLLLCRNTSSLLFLLPLRHCWGASSPLSLVADAIRQAAEEDAGGEGEDGDGVGMEYCPDWDRRDAHSTAVTELAAALVFLELHSRAYDLQNIWEEFKFSCIWGFRLIWGFKWLKSFCNQIFFPETKNCLEFGFWRKQYFLNLLVTKVMVMVMVILPYLRHNHVKWHLLDA